MASFSEANFSKKLGDLNPSQQSIQTLSLWLIHHRKHSKAVVEIWLRELKKAKTASKLTFLYLANDVVQNNRKKGPEYGKDFRTVLPDAYRHVSKLGNEKTLQSMGRLITIWSERSIFDPVTLKSLKKAIENASLADQNTDLESKGSASDATPTTPVDPQAEMIAKMKEALGPKGDVKEKKKRGKSYKTKDSEAPAKKKKKQDVSLIDEVERDLENQPDFQSPPADKLVKALEELENAASSDANVRERIAALPPEVSDVSMLEKLQDRTEAENLARTVDEACVLLSEYNSRLNSELEERKQVALMLRSFITAQKEALQAAEEELLEHKNKLQQVAALRKSLKVHIQSLPDMTLLPNVTGLAPLPSAGDLFSAGGLFAAGGEEG